jgi:transcriptional regulator with XRE-family HTH domain
MDVAELRHTFAERIKELRGELGLNQGEFADKVGVSRGAMSYYEQEARTPDIAVLRAICDKCGVSADYLTGLIADRDRVTADICTETGLLPKPVRRLQMIRRLQKIDGNVISKIVKEFGEETDEALQMLMFTAAPSMVNFMLSFDEGLSMLNMLCGVICGAKLRTGSNTQPVFELQRGHNNIEITFPAEHLESALWVNIQECAAKLREKWDAVYAEEPKGQRNYPTV